MSLKGKLISFISLLLIIMITWFVMKVGNTIPTYWTFGYEIPDQYPLLGIDVSHHQGDIYWEEVDKMNIKGDSLQFVFIKATEGQSLLDPEFEANSAGVNETDLAFGYYHYFHPSVSAREQAQFFCRTIENSTLDLRPVLDVEITGNLSNIALNDSIGVFLDEVKRITGKRPLIYTYESFYLDYLSVAIKSNELFWIASYNTNCQLMEKDNVLIWQFTDKGNVNGVGVKVDLNIGKEATLEKLR